MEVSLQLLWRGAVWRTRSRVPRGPAGLDAVYYGQVNDENVDSVYSFLQRALREAPADFPVRGPEAFTEGQFSYRNAYEGDVMRFWGQETIHADGRLVYTARYAGLVDRRSGD